MNVHDRQRVRQAVVRISRRRRLLLVPKGDVLDPLAVTRIDQRVIRMAALAEYLGDPFLFQALGSASAYLP
jgi:hypothetical protein